MFKKEVKEVTYKHEVDSMNATQKELKRGKSVTPNSSLSETVNELGNPGRLKVGYTVGKRPETKSVQRLK